MHAQKWESIQDCTGRLLKKSYLLATSQAIFSLFNLVLLCAVLPRPVDNRIKVLTLMFNFKIYHHPLG